MLLEGLHIPLTTPFHPDGRLNPHKLAANVARYSKTPAAGLIVLGPSGEPTLLSDDETRTVLRTVAQTAAPEKVLIAGISRDSVSATLDLAEYAASLAYDTALVGIPSMLAAESRLCELLTYFRTIADRSPLPIILLSRDKWALPVDAITELATHPNIIALLATDSNSAAGILARTSAKNREVLVTPTFAAVTTRMKNASGKATLVSAAELSGTATAIAEPPPLPALRTRTKAVGFQILAGNTGTLIEDLRNGTTAIAPTFAASAPQACYEVFAAWKDDDQPLADEKQIRLIEAARLAEATPGALKFACDLNGYFGGLPRLPHLPPNGAERAALEHLMQPLRN
ncbi:MAG TPA: dihydrodipicolinate synthase family protein [Acidobacteriaceae bacterium]